MTDHEQKNTGTLPLDEFSLKEFLERIPPTQSVLIKDLCRHGYPNNNGYATNVLLKPDIHIHCEHEDCNGIRFFRYIDGEIGMDAKKLNYLYTTYRCSNCQKTTKKYALVIVPEEDGSSRGRAYKIGEFPIYGPPTPSRLIKLIGSDKDIFLKGRRCENQGLGIGAFIYYRRVVENQKNRILEKIVQVLKRIGAESEKISTIERSIQETQFSKALDMAKDAMPESLLINGHSPIALLHSALSEGVHALSDEQCLEYASSIRIVLAELSDRISQALKDEAELSSALSTLMKDKS